MKATRFVVLALVSGSACAQSLEDGLYELSEQETAQSIVVENGSRYWLKERLDVALQENSVTALENSNERFQVTLRYPSDSLSDFSVVDLLSSNDGSSRFPRLALVIDDTRYLSDGSAGGNGQAAVFFYLSGADNAERVAEYFGTEVQYRSHPGHKLSVRFSPREQAVKLGDSVTVVLEITNVGDDSFRFDYGQRLPFRFFGTRRTGETIMRKRWPLRANDISTLRSVQPGETVSIEANIDNWLELEQPGVYYVLGSYRMEFVGAGPQAIWSEFVSDEFVVTVEP